MTGLIKFIKEALMEVRYKVSLPGQKELERLVVLFFVVFVICILTVLGINYVLQVAQSFVYGWMDVKEEGPN